MSKETVIRSFSKDEVAAAIKECARKLGRVPSLPQLQRETNISRRHVNRAFGSYARALTACGLERRNKGGDAVPLDKLFTEWAQMSRELGMIPTLIEYSMRSKFSRGPLLRRFGNWGNVPSGMLQYARESGLDKQWEDVLEMVKQYRAPKSCMTGDMGCSTSSNSRPRILPDRPLYGACLAPAPFAYAPTCEMGVVCMFGALAERLGFTILHMGTQYPDGEVIRHVDEGRWQRVRVEFEFRSREFLKHMHNPAECDLIVCWEHNWPQSPLEVIELRKYFPGLATPVLG